MLTVVFETLIKYFKKLNSEIPNLKGQLKIQTKQPNDMETLLPLNVKRQAMMVMNPFH